MTWIQLSVQIDAAHAEDTSAALEAAGAVAITLEDAGDDPVLEPAPGETPLWNDVIATALFEFDTPGIRDALAAIPGRASRRGFHLSLVADRPWEREWLRDFGPMRFGKRLWVCPGDRAPLDDDAVIIRRDPHLNFGVFAFFEDPTNLF